MEKTASPRKMLIISILLFTICLASLAGTTFAWFTDKQSSDNNVIMTGTLNVELYYQLEGQTEWIKVKKDTPLFTEGASWMPGHAETVRLKIVNEGELALKYKFGVNVAEEMGSTNAKGDDFALSEFIKFGIVWGEEHHTAKEMIAAVDATATNLSTPFVQQMTALLPKSEENNDFEDIVTLVVYMPESVGNEANPTVGNPVPYISLGVNLFATQSSYEEDGFDGAYDEDAPGL